MARVTDFEDLDLYVRQACNYHFTTPGSNPLPMSNLKHKTHLIIIPLCWSRILHNKLRSPYLSKPLDNSVI